MKNKNIRIVGIGILWSFVLFSLTYWFTSNYYLQSPVLLRTPFVSRYKKVEQKAKPKAVVTPTPVKKSEVEAFKKYLTEDGNTTRTKVLAYVSKYYEGDDLVAFDNLMKKEAGYRLDAQNGDSGACGMVQAYPCEKLGCALDSTGLECQTQWAIGYINRRYGTPTQAWNFHLNNNWY